MQEITKNLWTCDGVICVTTNGIVKKDGSAVMGKGCAKEAAMLFPDLPKKLGHMIKETGNQVYYFSEYNIITFPTKNHWRDPSDLNLIKKSCQELIDLNRFLLYQNPFKIRIYYLPRPGCGNGGLNWSEVKAEIEPILNQYKQIVIVNHIGGDK